MTETGFAAWLNSTSIWWLALLLLLCMFAAAVVGHVLRRWLARKSGTEGEGEGEGGFVLSSVLGLPAPAPENTR